MFEFLQPADRPVIDELEEHEIVLAERQPGYIPLRVLRGNTPEVRVISRWSPTPEQRSAILNGADIFLTVLTFGHLFQPVNLAVSDAPNPDYFRETLGLPGSEYEKGEAEREKQAHANLLKEREALRRAAAGEIGEA